jgi:CheY-like chemotaxis protein
MSVPQLDNTPSTPAQGLEPSNKMRHILVVDDEAVIATVLKEGLETLPNCQVMVAASGAEALQLFEKQPFDLLITDYQMPGMTGIVLATQVRQLYPNTAIIIITAYGKRILQESPIPDIPCLSKPVKLADIRNIALETLSNVSHSEPKPYDTALSTQVGYSRATTGR